MKKVKQFIRFLIIVLGITLAYRLNPFAIVICMISAVFCNCLFLKEEERRKIYLEKYKSLIAYMEQMAYSFKKQPKIVLAISDAQKVCTGMIKEVLEETLIRIDRGSEENIYENALKIIQEEYDCKRLRSLHEFLIKIEKHGGDYENYLDILLEDIRNWNNNTSLFIKDVERVKRNVLISIFSTLITCGFMAYLIPAQYQFTNRFIYQVCSTVMILTMMGAFILVQKKLNFDWTQEKSFLGEKMIIKYYFLVEKACEDEKQLSLLERLSVKKAKRRLEREIAKEFPDWIRDVAINLQSDTVQSAIENSYEKAPFVLKRPIRKLLIDFEKYPVGIEPYDRLLKEFELDEIVSSVKMFYSINELGKEDSQQQVQTIIERNNQMIHHAEEMKNKDYIGLASMYSAIPMLVGVVKIMIDMVLMILVFTSSVSQVLQQ